VIGKTFGPYQIVAKLGAGGMGEVYRARDSKLNRDVALKVLPPDMVRDADRLRRFELEARSASALNHPAIVAIYDLGEAESQHYMTMELIDGETLRALLKNDALPLRRALQIAAQVADGLAKAHDAGIIHRDLKPENIMISNDGFAKILDFGLAKLVDDSAPAATTTVRAGTLPGSVMGTVSYMSPEQASAQIVDTRSDQFSFGLVLYEMLSGRRAFSRATAAETIAAVIREEPSSLAELAPSVPAPVRWMVDRCLSKAPGDRYASTRDLARDLASARDNLSALTGHTHATAPAGLPQSRFAWRESIAWTIAALAVVALLVVWARRSEPPVGDQPPLTFTFPAPIEPALFRPSGSTHSPSLPTADRWRLWPDRATGVGSCGSIRSTRWARNRSPTLAVPQIRSGRPMGNGLGSSPRVS
jgi:serine/threonine protein kinase